MTNRTTHRSSKAPLGVTAVLAAAFVAGCGNDQTAYCVQPGPNGDDQVVENRYCDHYSPGFYWFFYNGSHAYVRGARIPRAVVTKAGPSARVPATVRTALSSHGFGSSARGGTGVGRAASGGGGHGSAGG